MNPENDKRLFLIDAFALIYRSYFAFIKNPIRNSKGIETSAAYGFTNTLNELIKKEQPTHIAVVFDAPEQTDRAVEHEFYKAHREAMPDGIRDMLPYIKNIVKAFNVPMYELAGYEADDIIGTIAKEKEKEGYTVFMVTPDKDFAQLVSENIFMYKPGRKGGEVEIIGIPEVKEKWEVEDPLQVIDILGMWGDSADNIPGIPGVGEKTAKKFIKEFGSMEGLFANTDKLKGKMKEKVEANKEKGIISKQLATIILDVPITVEDKDLNLEKPDFTELGKLFAELEFNNLAKRILGTNFDPSTFAKKGDQMSLFGEVNNSKKTPATETIEIANNFENIESIKPNYIHLKDEKDINALIEAIKKQKSFAFDTETTGLDSLNAEIVGISFCLEKNKAYYLPIELNRAKAKQRLAIFKTVLEDETIENVCTEINGIVVPANYNSPGQLVISGSISGIDTACEKLKEAGAKRAIVLQVGGAFHSPLMEPALEELGEAIENTEIKTPVCPIYQNVNALPEKDPEKIKSNLIAQLTSPVRWTQTVQNMVKDGFDNYLEVGGNGKVLRGLIRRIDRSVNSEAL